MTPNIFSDAKPKVIYLAHALGGDVAANLERAKRWYAWILKHYPNVAIVADWIVTAQVLDDNKPEDRARGMVANCELLVRCDELWICGTSVSNGIVCEVGLALDYEMPIWHFDFPEPPAEKVTPKLHRGPWTPEDFIAKHDLQPALDAALAQIQPLFGDDFSYRLLRFSDTEPLRLWLDVHPGEVDADEARAKLETFDRWWTATYPNHYTKMVISIQWD